MIDNCRHEWVENDEYCKHCGNDKALFDRIADLERQLQEAQRWKLAVDNELVLCHLGTTDSMEPLEAIASIGRWHYDLGASGACEDRPVGYIKGSTAGEPE